MTCTSASTFDGETLFIFNLRDDTFVSPAPDVRADGLSERRCMSQMRDMLCTAASELDGEELFVFNSRNAIFVSPALDVRVDGWSERRYTKQVCHMRFSANSWLWAILLIIKLREHTFVNRSSMQVSMGGPRTAYEQNVCDAPQHQHLTGHNYCFWAYNASQGLAWVFLRKPAEKQDWR